MADASIPASVAASLHAVEDETNFESSAIWNLQTAFYAQQGMKCWLDNTVPSFVSSNAYVANAYAKVVLSFLRDLYSSPSGDRAQPVYLIEVGAGSGKLAFLLLRELFDAWQSWPDLGSDTDACVDSSVRPFPTASLSGRETAYAPGPHAPPSAEEGAEGGGGDPASLASRRRPRLTGSGPCTFGHGPGGRRAPFRLVVTDVSPSTVAFWKAHESFSPFLEAGVVEFVQWDADAAGGSITLEHARGAGGAPLVLTREGLGNPVVCVANYCFSSLRTAAYRFGVAGVEAGRVTLYSERESDRDVVLAVKHAVAARAALPSIDADMIQRLRLVWSYRPVRAGEACADPAVEAVVRAYEARPSVAAGTTLTIPVGGIACLRAFSSLSKGRRLFCLAGDKAYAQEEELLANGTRDAHVALHGSFSCMLNLHALRLATLALCLPSNWAVHTPYQDGFKVAALWLGGQAEGVGGSGSAATPTPERVWASAASQVPASAPASLPQTLYTWADCMDSFGPENFSTLQRTVRDEVATPSLRLTTAVLRMACWDADVAYKFKQTLIDLAPGLSPKAASDLYADVSRIYARYYPLSPAKDLAFELGRVCMGMRKHHEAAALFWASIRHTGEHHVTLYNIGICLFHLGPPYLDGALTAFSRALALKPEYEDAASWRTRTVTRLKSDESQGKAESHDEAVPEEGAELHHGHSHAGGGSHGHSH